MGWNEPDNNGKDHDPWSGRQKGPQQQPPDLDEVFRKLQQKMRGMFGIKGGGSGPSADGQDAGSNKGAFLGFGLILLVILIFWALSGIFIVGAAEQAVVLRFGKYVDTVGPGAHWIPRFVDSQYKVNIQQITAFPYQAEMLTKDENIVDVAIVVQYRVDNSRDFLFNSVNPRQTLQEATASALRQVVGNDTLDQILTTGRQQVRQQVDEQLTEILDSYNVGLKIMDVTMQPAKPPEAVTAAFDDAIKAREDEQRYINQARAYSNRVEPIAHGRAQRLLENARAYKQQVMLKAQGKTARYLAMLPEYQSAPAVTRERLYLDAIESVLNKSSKVLLDVNNSNNLMYLPLDKIMQQTRMQLPRLDEGDPSSSVSTASMVNGTPKASNTGADTSTRPSRDALTNRSTNYAGKGA